MGIFIKEIETPDDRFVHALRDVYYAENQILKALPKMIKKASDPGLRRALSEHLEQTRTLEEEKEADEILTEVAKGRVNAEAA